VAQCDEVLRLSLAALEASALEAERQGDQRQKIGLVVIKRRACRGAMGGPPPVKPEGPEAA
jgi:hypothetical protein